MPVSNIPNRSLIRVSGAETMHFLHNLVTCDIEGLKAGELTAGALLTPQGKVLFDFLVGREGESYFIDCRDDIAADLAKRLRFYRLRAKVEIEMQEQALVSVWFQVESGGSEVESYADLRFPAQLPVTRSYGAIQKDDAGPAAYEALRIQSGVTEGGSDYVFGDLFPHDVNLDQIKGVSFSKGCYVGQEVVSRMQHRGTARRRVLIAKGNDALTARGELTAAGRSLGALGSAVGNVALALVRVDKAKDAMDAGLEILADGVPVTLSLPPNVSFGWPEGVGTGE
jgi:tRNA-modifying protein YgfZ